MSIKIKVAYDPFLPATFRAPLHEQTSAPFQSISASNCQTGKPYRSVPLATAAMASLRDFNLPRPSYIHLFPVITSTVAVVFSFIECMLLRSILSPSIPTAYAPTIWGSYITIGNNYIRFARRFLSGGGASAVSGLLCFESLQRTKGPAKALYTCGLAFSLLNFFVFLPHVS